MDKVNELFSYYDLTLGTERAKEVRLWFILGYDTLIRFFDPKYYKDVDMEEEMGKFFEKARIVCANRVMSSTSPLPSSVVQNAFLAKTQEQERALAEFTKNSSAAKFIARFKDRIVFLSEWLDSEVAGVSSTLVRGVLREYWVAKGVGKVDVMKELEASLRELIPAGVVEFVLEEELYKD